MKFLPECRTKKLGIWGSVCSFLNWEGADVWPQIRPRKIPVYGDVIITAKPICTGGTNFNQYFV